MLKAKPCKKNEWSCVPIHSIEVFQDYLFVGDGHYLKVYNLTSTGNRGNVSTPKYYSIFPPGVTISNICFTCQDDEFWIMVIGGKFFRKLTMKRQSDGSIDTHNYSMSRLQETNHCILAGRWMTSGDLVLVQGNNVFRVFTAHGNYLFPDDYEVSRIKGET